MRGLPPLDPAFFLEIKFRPAALMYLIFIWILTFPILSSSGFCHRPDFDFPDFFPDFDVPDFDFPSVEVAPFSLRRLRIENRAEGKE